MMWHLAYALAGAIFAAVACTAYVARLFDRLDNDTANGVNDLDEREEAS